MTFRMLAATGLFLGLTACPQPGDFELQDQTEVPNPKPNIVIDPMSVDFGPALVDEVQTESVLISNTGDALLHIDALEITDGPFVLLTPAPIQIPVGESVPVGIERTALDPNDVGWITVHSSDPDDGELVVDLTGQTLQAALEITPPVVDFGAVQVGTPATEFVTVTSVGEAPASLDLLLHQDVFEYQPPPLPLPLNPGASVQVAVRFQPTLPVLYGDVLRAQGTGDQALQPVQLKGRGYIPGIGSGSLVGRICDPSGNGWVVGARVWVDDGGVIVETTTDENGAFRLDGLTGGTHDVHVEKGSWSAVLEDADVIDGVTMSLPDDLCLSDDDVTVGVIPGLYDSVEVLLNDLGIDYESINDPQSLWNDPTELERFDVIFANCSEGEFGVASWNQANVADWVHQGGSLYASDYAFWLVEQVYPNMIEFAGNDNDRYGPATGASGSTTADVLDPAMQGVVGGPTAHIDYDLGAWMQMDATVSSQTLVQGQPPAFSGHSGLQPMVSRQFVGDGQVIYTTFHNEAQVTADMEVLLHEIILSL